MNLTRILGGNRRIPTVVNDGRSRGDPRRWSQHPVVVDGSGAAAWTVLSVPSWPRPVTTGRSRLHKYIRGGDCFLKLRPRAFAFEKRIGRDETRTSGARIRRALRQCGPHDNLLARRPAPGRT